MPVSLKFYDVIEHLQENLPWALACGKELGIKKAFPLVFLITAKAAPSSRENGLKFTQGYAYLTAYCDSISFMLIWHIEHVQ